jgi:hypothetical protein
MVVRLGSCHVRLASYSAEVAFGVSSVGDFPEVGFELALLGHTAGGESCNVIGILCMAHKGRKKQDQRAAKNGEKLAIRNETRPLFPDG